MFPRRLLLLLLVCALVHPLSAQTDSPAARLHTLLNEEWDYEQRTHPEAATSIGDKRFDDRLTDRSPEARVADRERKQKLLADFEAVPEKGLSDQDRLNRTLMIRGLRDSLDAYQFKFWETPFNQFGGFHLSLASLPTQTAFSSTRDFENYIKRLHAIPRAFDQVIANARQGMADGLMPPKSLLEQVVPQAESIAAKTDESSPFAAPLKRLEIVSKPDQERLRREILAAIKDEVAPAYARFAKFVRDEYAPHGRTEPGIWSLPDGQARYRYAIHTLTTTDLDPDEIHKLGLQQVAEIEAEMLEVAHKLGFKDVAALNEHIRSDRKLYGASGQQILGLYQKYTDQMYPELSRLFTRLPKSKLVVVPMESFREKAGVPADYSPGSIESGRPGRINVNMSDPGKRLLLNVEAIAYHEGIPGHHLQLSLGQEMAGLPNFRRHGQYTAFVEGWALYSERLAKEIGFYQDPYSDYGRLENEMWRAIRLVVDTGVHSKHWSRQQMVDYFHKYTAMDEPNIQTEVDRYIGWPGQALAYKLGQLRILALREKAKAELGSTFDIRAFHDELLGGAALPLDVLEQRMVAWIAANKPRSAKLTQ